MTVKYPIWINKIEGAAQTPEEMNGLVEVLQNHADNLSLQQKQILTSSGGIYPEKVIPTSPFPEGISQAVFLVGPGTYPNYGNKTIPANNLGLIFFYNSTFDLVTIEIPVYDDTSLKNRMTSVETKSTNTETKVDDFIRDFAVTTDLEFNSTSKNPIANSAVTKLYSSLKSYIDEIEDGDLLELSSSDYSYLKSDGSVLKEGQENLFKEVELTEEQKLKKYLFFKGYRAVCDPNQVQNFSSVIAVLEDDSIVEIITPFGITNVDNQEIYTLATEIPDNTVKLLICYSDYLKAKGSKPTIILSTLETLEDGVKKDINRFDTVLKSFLQKGEFLNISTSDNKFGYIKNDNTIVDGAENKYITISNLQDYERIFFKGHKAISSADNVNNYSTILAILDDNSTVSLLNMHPEGSVQTVQEFTINLPNRVKSLKVGWSVYQMPVTNVPKIRLLKGNEIKEDSVKEYIDSKVNGVDLGSTSILRFEKPNFVPIVNLVGEFPTDTTGDRAKTDMVLEFYEGLNLKLKCPIECKIQGQSSAFAYKKNWNVKLLNENKDKMMVKFGDWFADSSFHLKAFGTSDGLLNRDTSGARLLKKIFKSRPYPNSYLSKPTVFNSTLDRDANNYMDDAGFVLDSFPIILQWNGEFRGIYIWRQRRENANFRINDKVKENIYLANSNTINMQLNENFNHTQWELKSPKLKGYSENGEIPDAAVLGNINRLHDWCKALTSKTVDFEATYKDYINIENWVDVYIFNQVVGNWDYYWNNQNLVSWDGQKWSLFVSDLDWTVGLGDAASGDLNPAGLQWRGTFDRNIMYPLLLSRIKIRYNELRNNGVLSLNSIYEIYSEIPAKFGKDLYFKDIDYWTLYPNSNSGRFNVQFQMDWFTKKLAYLDNVWKL